jgi:uncharacterized protein YjiS (DUF1127 family)
MTKETSTLPRLRAARTAGLVSGMRSVVQVWRARTRTRQALSRLDAHMLRDIGLDAEAAIGEATRPFWEG